MLKFTQKIEQQRNFLNKKEYAKVIQTIYRLFLKNKVSSKISRYFTNSLRIFNSNSSYTKQRSVCILTGRTRSVYRILKLSRLKIREYGHNGYFVGFSKASW
jgi:small subunit ribosomal protein S14